MDKDFNKTYDIANYLKYWIDEYLARNINWDDLKNKYHDLIISKKNRKLIFKGENVKPTIERVLGKSRNDELNKLQKNG